MQQTHSMKDISFSNDLDIREGDFSILTSDSMHAAHIIMAAKGEYKANPAIGADIHKLLGSEEPESFLIEAEKNLIYDGAAVSNISFEQNGQLNVDAKYQ